MARPKKYDDDTLFITRTINASAILGIMDDSRWENIVAVVMRLMNAAEARERNARREPTLDGMVKATHFNGHVVAYENLLRTFVSLHTEAGRVLEEARHRLPYAPTSRGNPTASETLSQGILSKEEERDNAS